MTREELVEALERARTAKNIALAEVTAAHEALVAEAEKALADYDASTVTEAEVEAVVEETTPEATLVEEAPVESTETEDTVSPTAEEEEILRRAAEIEAKYQK